MGFNFIANATGIAALLSVGTEAGAIAARNAKQGAKTSVAVSDIKNLTGDALLNKPSDKHNAMKEMVRKGDYLTGFHKLKGGFFGFCSGLCEGMKGNMPTVGFSALTLVARNRTIKAIGAVGTGICLAWDFIKNGTNFFAKKDIIEK